MTKPKIFYWDACVYLAWLKNEEAIYGKDRMDAIQKILKDNFEKNAVIITSTLTIVEVLSADLTSDQEELFHRSFRPSDHIRYDLDPPIALKARDFRRRCLDHPSGRKLATPDAIHLATAVICAADEFLTFDKGGSDKKYLGLLGLSKDERVDELVISEPTLPPETQTTLL
jgi:predicted nucleic acid-binding protein